MRKIDKILAFLESTKIDTSRVADNYKVYDDSTFKMKFSINKLDLMIGTIYFLAQDKSFKETPKKVTEAVKFLTNNGFHPVLVNGVLNRVFDLTILPSLADVKVKSLTFYSDLIERAVKSQDFSKMEKFYRISSKTSLFSKFAKTYGGIK